VAFEKVVTAGTLSLKITKGFAISAFWINVKYPKKTDFWLMRHLDVKKFPYKLMSWLELTTVLDHGSWRLILLLSEMVHC
jgi:hypothetical protein